MTLVSFGWIENSRHYQVIQTGQDALPADDPHGKTIEQNEEKKPHCYVQKT